MVEKETSELHPMSTREKRAVRSKMTSGRCSIPWGAGVTSGTHAVQLVSGTDLVGVARGRCENRTEESLSVLEIF